MNKKEMFPLITGIIGLIADFIGIYSFISQKNVQDSEYVSYGRALIMFTTLIYGWFVIAWFLIRSRYVKEQGKIRQYPVFRTTVLGIGIVTFFISLLISSISNVNFIPSHVVLGGLGIYFSIKLLMPVIYPEMETYVTRVGYYRCRKTFNSNFNGQSFTKGEEIKVIGLAFPPKKIQGETMLSFYPSLLFYYEYVNQDHKMSEIHFKDLVEYFALSNRQLAGA